MRPLLTLALFLSLISCQAQFSLSYRDVKSKQNYPRFSWSIPVNYPLIFKNIHHVQSMLFSPWETKKPFLTLGIEIQNNGIYFKDTGSVLKISGISAGPNVSLTKQFGHFQKESGDWEYRFMGFNYIRLSCGINYFFYNKEKVFRDGNVLLFEKDFLADKLNNPDQFIRLSAGAKDLYNVYVEYHFQSFLNKGFQTTRNGVIVNPFYDYQVSRINAGIKFDVVYMTVATAGVLFLINSLFK